MNRMYCSIKCLLCGILYLPHVQYAETNHFHANINVPTGAKLVPKGNIGTERARSKGLAQDRALVGDGGGEAKSGETEFTETFRQSTLKKKPVTCTCIRVYCAP